MTINTQYSTLTRFVNHIGNADNTLGVLLEEIPADIGRSVAGYKRGGILEGTEKMRKELMSAVVWLFGIRVFNKIGNYFCEKVLKIPMDIDICNINEGNNTIGNTVEYIKTIANKDSSNTTEIKNLTNLDVREIEKYTKGKIFDKIKGTPSASMEKQIKGAKMVSILSALALNCILMGIVLPKINQKITRKKMEEMNGKNSAPKFESMDEFISKCSEKNKEEDISFKGINRFYKKIENYAYQLENNNTTRLVSTDIPMITGRAATSRNKFEALEFITMDGGSIYFYNFCSGHVQKIIRKFFTKVPDINPKIAEEIKKLNPKILNEALNKTENAKTITDLFSDKDIEKQFYQLGTYGKYGKINRFVKNSDLKEIDKKVVDCIKYIKIKKEKGVNLEKIIKDINNKNAFGVFAGLSVSILGLAVIMPKLTFWITKQLTGKNTFAGITDYDDNKV